MKFSQSQISMNITLPSQDDLDHFRKIEAIMASPGIQDVIFDVNKAQNEYISDGWKIEKSVFLYQERLKYKMLFE